MSLHSRHDSPEERASMIPAGYSPVAHIVRTAIIAGAIGAAAIWLASRAAPIDWLLLPAFFAVANFIEWAVHKNPMHRPLTPRFLYTNHALIHHRAFEHDSMPVHNARELGLIMMPWYTMLGLFVLASPVGLLAAWWRGWGAAGIFFLGAAIYFLAYESMHALYHQTDATLKKVGLGGPLFERLRAHHRHHHRLGRMAHVNFNVTFPLMDWLMGTKEAATPIEARVDAPAPAGEPAAPQRAQA